MRAWTKIGLGILVLFVIGAVAKQAEQPPKPPPAPALPKTEEQQALERCTVAMWAHYGHDSVSGPGADWWTVKKAGGVAALYTVQGRNALGVSVVNTLECEEARDAEGEWQIPYIWNATTNGNRLDPSSINERRPRRFPHKPPPMEH